MRNRIEFLNAIIKLIKKIQNKQKYPIKRFLITKYK
ncbi:hypothetical protein EV194_11165 [Natronoflexus pectinivorans]|uniref:Uncharacterized protein n=1 Tax=Natronoflexus pectinivorans TaxID=682526 RepID=A0A4R2GFG5_9BACT|nr:hypothetical protein EV194_11165 [Natronoflexus pectinivorans]